jgi:hypothetical protein
MTPEGTEVYCHSLPPSLSLSRTQARPAQKPRRDKENTWETQPSRRCKKKANIVTLHACRCRCKCRRLMEIVNLFTRGRGVYSILSSRPRLALQTERENRPGEGAHAAMPTPTHRQIIWWASSGKGQVR